ncbi:NAD(P)/FAD-dependent oxidoreductase [Candidatus Sumerlaeota bacterium]|nr:NAD(P)/FAD-dependent oxidoreductase [Candidatus Sumerlaeota bacterium]MBI3736869.1 NAD(P)/FAD-dependent oxidoreductase [Candidatus Sumerlaeota bacterium]
MADQSAPDNASNPPPLDAAIIGSGFAGICMAIQLRKAGIENFLVFEKSDSLGGTWRDNTYPGAACDVPSFLYSFSFEIKTDWSKKFAEQPEILGYLEHCARKYGVEPHLRFKTEIAEARYDDSAGTWRLRTAAGNEFAARVLISGTGQLNRPLIPHFQGLESFAGTQFHSARWRHDYDLTGKRVGVIGNGASALQFIPLTAPRTSKLTLFQRSANWIVPKPDHDYTPKEKAFYTRHRLLSRLYRWYIYLLLEARWPVFSRESWMGRWFARASAARIAKIVRDPHLRQALTPDYAVGCKRVLQSGDYYEALTRDNVEVVTSPIEQVEPCGIRVADGSFHELDAIIFGTGFETTHFLAPMRVEGKGGITLDQAWIEGAEAYLGIAVSGFPNFFLLYGPNTNLGHNSIIFMIECQAGYIMQCLEWMKRRNLRALDVARGRMDDYNKEIQATLARSVWATGCSSWYKTGAGKVTNNWAYSTIRYWWRLRRPDWSAFVAEPR